MRRVVAWLLAGTLSASSCVAVALHAHAYHEHDHPEHHHGPAMHGHDDAAGRLASPDDAGHGRPPARLAPCDAAAHVVSIAFVFAPAPQVHVDGAVLPSTAIVVPPPRLAGAVRHGDVRVHGPPLPASAAPRAPPLIAPA